MVVRARRALSERVLTSDLGGATLPDAEKESGSARFRGYEHSVCLGTGPSRWALASTEVLRWGIKTRSGFTVEASDESSGAGDAGVQAVAGHRYWLTAHLGPLRIHEPVQVVAVVDEPDRKGFAYATLSGHPVSGEEAFVVERRPDGTVWLTIRSRTRPAAGPWRFAYPFALLAQRPYRRRYFRALSD